MLGKQLDELFNEFNKEKHDFETKKVDRICPGVIILI